MPRSAALCSAVSPSSQPPRKARLVGRGRGASKTSTAGMIDSGESAVTSARGMSPVSTEPKLSATGSNLLIDTSPSPQSAPRAGRIGENAEGGNARGERSQATLGWLYIRCGATTFALLVWATTRQEQTKQVLQGKHWGKITWLGFILGTSFTSPALRC
jgi:hypothetical protein